MPSAFWKGTLSFGLVEIPVSLRPAVDEKELSFTLLDSQGDIPIGARLVTFGDIGNRPFVPEVPIGHVISVQPINKGCSGMAGTYGLKRENFRHSIR